MCFTNSSFFCRPGKGWARSYPLDSTKVGLLSNMWVVARIFTCQWQATAVGLRVGGFTDAP